MINSGTKKNTAPQKVIMVKKIPAKAIKMDDEEYYDEEDISDNQKIVSFSSEDEILEIAPRRVVIPARGQKTTVNIKKGINIKSRLGTSNYYFSIENLIFYIDNLLQAISNLLMLCIK